MGQANQEQPALNGRRRIENGDEADCQRRQHDQRAEEPCSDNARTLSNLGEVGLGQIEADGQQCQNGDHRHGDLERNRHVGRIL